MNEFVPFTAKSNTVLEVRPPRYSKRKDSYTISYNYRTYLSSGKRIYKKGGKVTAKTEAEAQEKRQWLKQNQKKN